MSALSPAPGAVSRNPVAISESFILRRVGSVGLARIAAATGRDETTVMRFASPQEKHPHGWSKWREICEALNAMGLKVVPVGNACFPREQVEAWYAAYREKIAQCQTIDDFVSGNTEGDGE